MKKKKKMEKFGLEYRRKSWSGWWIVKMGSISAAMSEYAIPIMCKRWSNKNKTCQLKNAN